MAQVNLLVLYLHLEVGSKLRYQSKERLGSEKQAPFSSFKKKSGRIKGTVNCSVPWRIQKIPKTMVTIKHTSQVLI